MRDQITSKFYWVGLLLLGLACLVGCSTSDPYGYRPSSGYPGSLADQPRDMMPRDRSADYRPSAGASASSFGQGGSMVRGGRDVLRAGDEVRVTLGGVPRDERVDTEFRINDDGSITMPNLDPVRAAGSTASMLERVLEQQYKSKGIYTNPTVSVYVAGRFINVIGEVRLPQRVEFTSDLTVLSAVAAAGGFTDYANKKAVRVTRGGQVITVNAVAASRNPAADERLQAGDTIEVQRSIF